jgi:diguanylate cyclase (GGDEF)-like protein
LSTEILSLLGPCLWAALGAMMLMFGVAWCLAGRLASPARRAINLVAAFNIVEGAGLILVGLRDELPLLIGTTLAYLMTVVAYVLMWRGAAELIGLRDMRRQQIALVAISCIAVLLLGGASHAGQQQAVAFLANAWVGLRAGWQVARKLKASGGVAMAAVALICSWGMALPLAAHALGTLVMSDRYGAALSLAVQPVLASLGLLFAFMCNLLVAYVVFGRTARELNRLNELDTLTGLPRNTITERALDFEWRAHHHRGKPLAVLALAIDDIGHLRNGLGSGASDLVITEVALELKQLLRPQDVLGHEGAGQFLVLLPGTNAMLAESIAQFTVRTVANDYSGHSKGGCLVTLSIGVAMQSEVDDAPALLRLARQRRGAALATGGNRAEAGPGASPWSAADTEPLTGAYGAPF